LNFLAHALLAGDHSALIVGGVVGDWIKGPLPGSLPGDLSRGVALHRAIDSFAETHPAFRVSRNRISPARRRYAGILVDVFYDHLLARDWQAHHDQPLADYCQGIYRMIDDRLPQLPEHAHPALRLMAAEDWLRSYAEIDGIADVLARMSRRARQPNPLAGGDLELLADIQGFDLDFTDWLRDARSFVRQWSESKS
jgi:acyl carrier protein phosphodiesterase